LAKAIPHGRVFRGWRPSQRGATYIVPLEDCLDKLQKEALLVAKEMLAKFIETRTVSPNTFAEVFPSVYRVIYNTLRQDASFEASHGARQEDA